MRRPGARWARPALLAGLILVAAVVPLPGGTAGPAGLDTLLHLLAHAALAAALVDALDPGRAGDARTLALAAALSGAYGVGIEGIQVPLATRSAEAADALATVLGSALGAVAWRYRRSR